MAQRQQQPESPRTKLVLVSFNCEGWDEVIVENLLQQLSSDNTKQLALFCQETWLYDVSPVFRHKISSDFNIIHLSAMDTSTPRARGRPFGGLAAILSKEISYKTIYENSRCQSIMLTEYNMLISNVYMPYSDSRISMANNVERYMEAIGHLDAAHETAGQVDYSVVLGDFNCDPSDKNNRAEALASWLNDHNYEDSDLLFYTDLDATHKSGRIIDRICTSSNLLPNICNIGVRKSFSNSDHFPIISEINLPEKSSVPSVRNQNIRLNWKNASNKAKEANYKLSNKMCSKDLQEYQSGNINGQELYNKLVRNLEVAANTCIPKKKKNITKSHNIPHWRQRMSSFQTTVDYWLQLQFLQGGPRRCDPFVRQQLRVSRARYKREHRALRREIRENIAEYTTTQNCFNVLFKKNKPPSPAYINGKSRNEQPEMWRKYFMSVFKAKNIPFSEYISNTINSNANVNIIKY